jgi:RIO-like serine/threonine protein kinase
MNTDTLKENMLPKILCQTCLKEHHTIFEAGICHVTDMNELNAIVIPSTSFKYIEVTIDLSNN